MKMTTTNRKKNSGFTLIELMVTVSIATILMSIAVPSFTNMIKSNQLTAGTNELISALILARSEALKRSNNVSVCASVDQASCSGSDFSTGWIVFVDCSVPANGVINAGTDCDGDGTPDGDTIVKVHGKVGGMTGITKTNTASYQTFRFTGRSPVVSTFSVATSSNTNTVTVSLSGRISLN